ncbi:molybdopterin-dependent oxidoreductase [Pseudodesulfovibrio cashew]|uniref:Molybdopterin-dependent oxidoreductase n=1 Tax=Pseudodesulfovibrio cashew TaxID=2678688 RepID=A0A6I6JLV6_9BACT|nr:molybdopterin-dependent oxidoreductase [Pseudodesulfovibrio cashew]QGY41920.1 molybdopterin-dependent oxidoreductase [Pseudodesulfovibrio cashew]
MTTHKTICPYDCPTTCGLLVEAEGDRIVKVRGDADDPKSRGLICRKMHHYERSIHSQNRILTPLKRTGAKGEGRFEPITWDEAIDTITTRWKRTLDEVGPDAILPFYYSGVMSFIHRFCGDSLFNRMGACSLVKTLCASAKGAGYSAVMGKTGCLDPRELADSDFYIVWGSNMKATRLQSMADIVAARKSGKRVVLIESYAEDMASHCDQVILIKPGTDGALALAMMHVLAEEGLADTDFLLKEAIGFESFRETLTSYTPEWAEGVTGVPASVIVELAREFGAASAPAIILGSGNSRHGNGGMTVRLITILSAFTGAWARPGGGLCGCGPGGGPFVDMARITRPDLRTNTARKVNINQLASALAGEDGQASIRCLHIYACNPVSTVCHQQGIVRGLLNPDLFTVVHERFMTDTARYADIILPATFSVEQADCYGSYGYCSFGAARKIISAPGECKSNWEIFRLLAKAMGYKDSHFDRTDEELLEELLAHPEPDLLKLPEEALDSLRTGGQVFTLFADHTDWETPSGKMMIVNDELATPMPQYLENHGGEYPLRLIAAPSSATLNSTFLEREDLVAGRGPMTLVMHLDDAASRGIADGDSIVAFNELGEVRFEARVSSLVARGAVVAVGVFHSGRSMNGNLVNTLHHERLSDIGEATTLNDNTVEVRKDL